MEARARLVQYFVNDRAHRLVDVRQLALPVRDALQFHILQLGRNALLLQLLIIIWLLLHMADAGCLLLVLCHARLRENQIEVLHPACVDFIQ